MAEIKGSLIRRTRALAGKIDEFLDLLGEAGLAYEQGVHHYLGQGADADVERRLDQISRYEGQADGLQRTIETALYAEMLIPEARGDVLGLLDDLDHLFAALKNSFLALTIERPIISEPFVAEFREMATVVVKAVMAAVTASRAYFRDVRAVRDHHFKIAFFEREADKLAIRLARRIFASDLPLDRKMHLRDCLRSIDRLADLAEDVGDQLIIYAVKRSH